MIHLQRQLLAPRETDAKQKFNKNLIVVPAYTAKGLEFDTVFLPNWEEGVFPSYKSNEDNIEEERRLAYVAYTRAKDALFLTDSDGYTYNGEEKYTSRFVTELQKDSLNILNEPNRSFVEDL